MQEVQISLKSIEDVKHFVQNIPALAVAIPADLSGRFTDDLCQFIYAYVTLITQLTQIIGENYTLMVMENIDAKKYYEDVIRFVMKGLGEITKNHMQSGNCYNATDFFPYGTDR